MRCLMMLIRAKQWMMWQQGKQSIKQEQGSNACNAKGFSTKKKGVLQGNPARAFLYLGIDMSKKCGFHLLRTGDEYMVPCKPGDFQVIC